MDPHAATHPSRSLTRVVNLHHQRYDVYIGRAGRGEDGYFGNPVPVRTDRARAIEEYEAYFLARITTDATFRERVLALRGLTLGCFCKPHACHGDVIARWLGAQS